MRIGDTKRNELACQITNGNLYNVAESAYRLDQLRDAMKHAYQMERNGKVLLMPNGLKVGGYKS